MKKTLKYFLVLLFFFAGALTVAQQNSIMQTVYSQEHALVKTLTPISRMDTTKLLNLAIGLPLRNQDELSSLLSQMYDPSNSNYHHYLTTDQFTVKFGPSAQDYQAVIAFAKSNGLSIIKTYSNRMVLDVRGTVSNIEKSLNVTLNNYRHPIESRTFYAPDCDLSLKLSVPIQNIIGLSNYSYPHPSIKCSRIITNNNISPNSGSKNNLYIGNDFRAAYAPNLTLTGTGQKVGLVQFDGFNSSDIDYYENTAHISPHVPLDTVLLDGYDGVPSGTVGQIEVSLDIEMAISMDPGLSEVILYEAGPYGYFDDVLNRVALLLLL